MYELLQNLAQGYIGYFFHLVSGFIAFTIDAKVLCGWMTSFVFNSLQGKVSRTWIIYNRPDEPNAIHAGLLFALGLHGHLTVLTINDIFQYYNKVCDKVGAQVVNFLLYFRNPIGDWRCSEAIERESEAGWGLAWRWEGVG